MCRKSLAWPQFIVGQNPDVMSATVFTLLSFISLKWWHCFLYLCQDTKCGASLTLCHPHTSTHAIANLNVFIQSCTYASTFHLSIFRTLYAEASCSFSTLNSLSLSAFLPCLMSSCSTFLPAMGSRLSRWCSHLHRRSISKAGGKWGCQGGRAEHPIWWRVAETHRLSLSMTWADVQKKLQRADRATMVGQE